MTTPTATTRETTLTVTSPRTGVTYSATVITADSRVGSYSMKVGVSSPKRAPISVTAFIAADGTIKVGTPLKHIILAHGHLDDVEVTGDARAEIVAGVEFMWSKMAPTARAMRMVSLLQLVASLREEGDFELAARVGSRI